MLANIHQCSSSTDVRWEWDGIRVTSSWDKLYKSEPQLAPAAQNIKQGSLNFSTVTLHLAAGAGEAACTLCKIFCPSCFCTISHQNNNSQDDNIEADIICLWLVLVTGWSWSSDFGPFSVNLNQSMKKPEQKKFIVLDTRSRSVTWSYLAAT